MKLLFLALSLFALTGNYEVSDYVSEDKQFEVILNLKNGSVESFHLSFEEYADFTAESLGYSDDDVVQCTTIIAHVDCEATGPTCADSRAGAMACACSAGDSRAC